MTKDLQEKVVYQPCLTTLVRRLYPQLPKRTDSKLIAFNIAFDRPVYRFEGKQDIICKQLALFAKRLQGLGYQIVLSYHVYGDDGIRRYMDEDGVSYWEKDLRLSLPLDILLFYNQVSLTVSTRGHGSMIPFGLNGEIISLGTHPKMRYFLEDIDALDWYVDLQIDTECLADKMQDIFQQIHDKKDTKERLFTQQIRLAKITEENMCLIKNKLQQCL